jgi:hypothetical protein
MSKLFIDMDGVLADFDTHHEATFGFRPNKQFDNVDWNAVGGVKNFHLGIPPMPDLPVLWSYIERLNPMVLTGVPASVEEVPENKRAWVRKHLGNHIEVICCRSWEKSLHANNGDILIDDWEKYRHLWVAKGGCWITHVSAEKTVEELRALGL